MTSDTQRSELLPCPFCGGEPHVGTRETESLWSHDIVTYTTVGCSECDISFSTEPGYEVESPAAWNRRTPPKVGSGELDAAGLAAAREARDAAWPMDSLQPAIRAYLALAAPVDHPEVVGVEVSIKPMRLSDERCDYFVAFKCGGREVTPHVFRERFKAEYHVALYRWLLGQGTEPGILEFREDEWPAREFTPEEQRAFAALQPSDGPALEAGVKASATMGIERRHIQALGAALSRRDWCATDIAYNNILYHFETAALATPAKEPGK